jgi:hypothetical protein
VVRWVRGLQAIAQSGLADLLIAFCVIGVPGVGKIAAEIADSSSVAATNRIDTLFSEEFGYATPRLHTRAVASSGANTWAAP